MGRAGREMRGGVDKEKEREGERVTREVNKEIYAHNQSASDLEGAKHNMESSRTINSYANRCLLLLLLYTSDMV